MQEKITRIFASMPCPGCCSQLSLLLQNVTHSCQCCNIQGPEQTLTQNPKLVCSIHSVGPTKNKKDI